MNEIASRQSSVLLRLMQRGEEQHSQCGWHLRFCADLSRTAPLGSRSRANLFRRYLSSPVESLYHSREKVLQGCNRRILETQRVCFLYLIGDLIFDRIRLNTVFMETAVHSPETIIFQEKVFCFNRAPGSRVVFSELICRLIFPGLN